MDENVSTETETIWSGWSPDIGIYLTELTNNVTALLTGVDMSDTTATIPPLTQPPPGPAETVDIVDEIDALVNDQLAGYEHRSGFDHNVSEETCPKCGRSWHGLRITQRMEEMRVIGRYNETYRYADDTSETLCDGSTFIGPTKHPAVENHARPASFDWLEWANTYYDGGTCYVGGPVGSVTGSGGSGGSLTATTGQWLITTYGTGVTLTDLSRHHPPPADRA